MESNYAVFAASSNLTARRLLSSIVGRHDGSVGWYFLHLSTQCDEKDDAQPHRKLIPEFVPHGL